MINFPEAEKKTLKTWQEKEIFKKTLEKTKKGKSFVFFEGPPTANGKPGIHHVLARAFKDVIPRYKTMRGFYVERKAGWDTHGLPVELEVEKELKISGKPQIEKYGIEKFNKKCQENVWKYKKDWEEMTRRLGFWLDLKNPYVTYENDYIESEWWILKQIWDKGLLYQGHKVVPQCPRCGTALSSHEVAQGYEKVTEDSVYIKFELADEPGTFVLAWTTTPWTLPGNVALALGPKLKYVKVKAGREFYILAKDRLNILLGKYKVVEEYYAKDLEGRKYKPLFDFLDLAKETDKCAYYLALADFVTVEDGTGVVHTAVMYGEDDYNLGEKLSLPKIHTLDENGIFNHLVKPWQGRFVKDRKLEEEIVDYLKKKNLLYKTEKYTHDYPFCWRCDSPLLYYAKNSWFIKMSALREELKKNNEKITWVPNYIKEGRFGEWINEVKDWAISRERYWGTPLPVWRCEKCQKYRCVGSREELGVKDINLHRPYVDEIKLKCPCGGQMSRVPEVIDCWFDSGSMPFAQVHYPFKNKERIDKGISFPADFISEAMDQTRGWFYTLLAISTLLDKGPAYKNVICLGLVLDKNGQKMSKSRGNVVNPQEVFEKFGADAIRWYFYTINQPGETKNFDPAGLNEVIKKNFLILFNVLSFYQMYVERKVRKITSQNILDRWILTSLHLLIRQVSDELDHFQVVNAARKIEGFINDLSTWYLRRSRRRFKSEDGIEKEEALATLQDVLLTLSKILAPFLPFLAEEFYRLAGGLKESVHLADWPGTDNDIEQSVIEQMLMVRQIVELAHALRAENGFKVRQPLSQLVTNASCLDEEYALILKEELNVKELHFVVKKPNDADFKIKEKENLWVALDTTLTDELKEEGIVREIVRQINALRKEAKLTLKNKIRLGFATEDEFINKLFTVYAQKLEKEVLAENIKKLKKTELEKLSFHKELKIEGKDLGVGF